MVEVFQSNTITAAQWIDDHYPDNKEVVVTTMPANIQETFNPVKEFSQLFLKQIPCELRLLHGISHEIISKPAASWIPAFRLGRDRFKKEISKKINKELVSAHIYQADD